MHAQLFTYHQVNEYSCNEVLNTKIHANLFHVLPQHCDMWFTSVVILLAIFMQYILLKTAWRCPSTSGMSHSIDLHIGTTIQFPIHAYVCKKKYNNNHSSNKNAFTIFI